MKYGVRLKINVSMIEKAKLFSGQKGKYLDATVFIDVDNKDQYDNNGMITQDAPKGEQGAILGNAQVFWSDGGQQAQQRPQGASNSQGYQANGQQYGQQQAPQQQQGQAPQQQPQQGQGYQQPQQQQPNLDEPPF